MNTPVYEKAVQAYPVDAPVGHCPPVNQAFTGIAYLRKLAAHRRRISRELAALPPLLVPRDLERICGNGDYRGLLPGKRPWDDLKVVNCAKCNKLLLGESEEPFRTECLTPRPGRRGPLRCVKFLPPPVAARVNGRPICTSCCEGA